MRLRADGIGGQGGLHHLNLEVIWNLRLAFWQSPPLHVEPYHASFLGCDEPHLVIMVADLPRIEL
jgi:hypothetical protein